LRRLSFPDGPFSAARDGVRVAIRLTPKARADRIEEVVRDSEGGTVLKVAVAAPPVKGRANDALLDLLAREWRLPRRSLSIVSGATHRNKLVAIAGDPVALLPRLTALIAVPPSP
jgi:uncharacterized protein (TIGR00251 family)